MTTTYSSLFDQVSYNTAPAGVITTATANPQYIGPVATMKGTPCHFSGTVTVSTNLAIADLVRFLKVPKGARLGSFTHEWGDLDSATTLVAHLGWETSDPDAFLASSAIYQAADTTIAAGGGSNSLTQELTELVFDNAAVTADTDYLSLTCTVAATSLAAAATITFRGWYYLV